MGVLEIEKLLLVAEFGFLDGHVLEFAGLEDIAAFLALDVLGIFVAGNDLYARVLAQITAYLILRGLRRLARRHKLRGHSSFDKLGRVFVGNWRYFAASYFGCQVPIGSMYPYRGQEALFAGIKLWLRCLTCPLTHSTYNSYRLTIKFFQSLLPLAGIFVQR